MTLGTALSSREEGNAGEGVPHLLETWGPSSKGRQPRGSGRLSQELGWFSHLHSPLLAQLSHGHRAEAPGAGCLPHSTEHFT